MHWSLLGQLTVNLDSENYASNCILLVVYTASCQISVEQRKKFN